MVGDPIGAGSSRDGGGCGNRGGWRVLRGQRPHTPVPGSRGSWRYSGPPVLYITSDVFLTISHQKITSLHYRGGIYPNI